MPQTFESLLVNLARAEVRFLVAGGVAVCLNGYVRTTQDLDILVEGSPENLHRLLDCLSHFGDGFARELTVEDFGLEEGAVRIIEDFTLDVFTLMRSRTYGDFAADARELVVEGTRICFLSPSALIKLKSESSREKDQLDVAALRRLLAGEEAPTPVNLSKLAPYPGGDT